MEGINSGLSFALSQITEIPNLPDSEQLTKLLYRIVSEKPWIDVRYDQYSERFAALLPPLAILCARQIREADNNPVSLPIIKATRLIGQASYRYINYQTNKAAGLVKSAISTNTAINRQLFWLAVHTRREEKGELWGYQAAHGIGELWSISAQDLNWLIFRPGNKKSAKR